MNEYIFEDLENLDDWLKDSATPDGALSLAALEGYLVAIATHLPQLPPEVWLPPIFGYAAGAQIVVDPARGDKQRLLSLIVHLYGDYRGAQTTGGVG